MVLALSWRTALVLILLAALITFLTDYIAYATLFTAAAFPAWHWYAGGGTAGLCLLAALARRNLAAALVKCPELRECGADGILLSLGDVIGSQELESQLVALDSVLALLKRRLAEEDAAYGKYGGLYRRLGVLGGLALAVVFL